MKHKILTIAICIACGVPMATRAEISGYVEERYSNGGLHTFIATYDGSGEKMPWEYICSNSFDDMELAFADLTLEFGTEDEHDGYSYVDDCDITNRMCASGKYIYSFKRDDGVTEYACKDCPAAPNGEKITSYSYWDYWRDTDGLEGGITDCHISSRDQFTDDTGTYKYTANCYYKK